MELIRRLAQEPGWCIALTVFFWLVNYGDVDSLLSGLLKMHRSKTAVKKLKNEYKFSHRLTLRHYEEKCLHAVTFCKILVWYVRGNAGLLLVYMLLSVGYLLKIFSATALSAVSICLSVVYLLPIMILGVMLNRPLIGRFNKYSFEKYHNTDDHSSLI